MFPIKSLSVRINFKAIGDKDNVLYEQKAQIEKKDLEIAFLKAKSIRQHNKLTEQSNLLSTLHNQKEKMQQDVYAYSQHVKKKVN